MHRQSTYGAFHGEYFGTLFRLQGLYDEKNLRRPAVIRELFQLARTRQYTGEFEARIR
jgi:hypothetical protein